MLDIVSTASIPIFVTFIVVEFLFSRAHALGLYEKKDAIASLTVGIVSVGFSTVSHGLLVLAMAAINQWVPWSVPNTVWGWVAAFIVTDVLFYWHHRVHHEMRLCWASHVVHHSSQNYNYAVALRQGWTETITSAPFYLPLAFLGFSPEMYLVCYGLNLVYQFFPHTQTVRRLGVLEWVMNTPSHHRVHHGSNLRYLDANYAGVFIVWDRLFGTFVEECDDEPVVYGLISDIDTFNPIRINTESWVELARDAASAGRFGVALRYLFGPPGWHPDERSATVAELRAREAEAAAAGAQAAE